MAYVFDDLIFIGRFQPFHVAHQQVIETALQYSQRVILVIGSAQDERSIKNPFSAAERQKMILNSLSDEYAKRIQFIFLPDVYNDEKWVNLVKTEVAKITQTNEHIGLIGHIKDDSSYYLKLFPQWKLVELPNLHDMLSATPLRKQYFQGEINRDKLPPAVQAFLQQFQKSKIYPQLQQKYQQDDYSIVR